MNWIHSPLRLHNKKWYPVYFLLGLVAVAVASFTFPGGERPELLFSGMAAVTGLTYFFYRQHLDETKLFKELFIEFNERYGKLNDRLNSIRFGPLNAHLSDADRDLLFTYFNLCAEEYFFYQAGYIDHAVWESWKKGMGLFFSVPRIRELWNIESKSSSYYGFSPD
jgi:hypothetical protein